MTVTPFTRREPHPVRLRPGSGPTDAGLTLSLEVTLGGENRYSEAVQIIETLRRLTSDWGPASVAVNPPVAATTVTRLEPAARAAARVIVSPGGRSVLCEGQAVELTRVEFDLLHFLAAHPRRVFSRAQLLQSVWGYSHAGHRTVDVHIRRVRAKVGPLFTTVRSIGYRLADDADVVVAHS